MGVALRTIFYKLIFKKIGLASIKNGVEFKAVHKISLGNAVTIKKHSYLNGNTKDYSGLILGDHCFLDHYAYIKCQGASGIKIGNGTYIGPFTQIISVGPISIGENCLIAGQCFIVSGDHPTDGTGPINKTVKPANGITIGNGCWIGANVKIVDGVKIGNGVVIGAGSVVTRNIPDNTIAVGCPAHVIKERK